MDHSEKDTRITTILKRSALEKYVFGPRRDEENRSGYYTTRNFMVYICTIHLICSRYDIEEFTTPWACGPYGRQMEYLHNFGSWRNRRLKTKWEDNMYIHRREI
jgi:hypothetical protein